MYIYIYIYIYIYGRRFQPIFMGGGFSSLVRCKGFPGLVSLAGYFYRMGLVLKFTRVSNKN